MANPQKAWKAEYAKSARSSCKTCKSIIDKEILRLGKMVQAKQFDGVMPMWNHASCILKKANQIKFITDVEGIESLRWEDQQRIRKYVEEGGGNDDSSGPPGVEAAKDMEYGIELSQTSRAHCKGCSEKIMKGEDLEDWHGIMPIVSWICTHLFKWISCQDGKALQLQIRRWFIL
uniref:PARP-type domain-containing protein n=1 Tax=Salix viminalis TaxID=40686 RepID=A0A6N2KME6_SALVM